jgi:hypothetical protein
LAGRALLNHHKNEPITWEDSRLTFAVAEEIFLNVLKHDTGSMSIDALILTRDKGPIWYWSILSREMSPNYPFFHWFSNDIEKKKRTLHQQTFGEVV